MAFPAPPVAPIVTFVPAHIGETVVVAKLIVGNGFTVTSTVNGVPLQVLFDGVTVYLTTPDVVVALVNVCTIGPATPVD